MISPGSNLLKSAFKLIAKQKVGWLKWLGREVNSIGNDVDKYAARKDLMGSFQPVPRSRYEMLGLDFSKSYATFYSTTDIGCIEQGRSGDIILFAGRQWKCEAPNDWYAVDGWTGVLMIDIGPEQKDATCDRK